MFFLTWLNFTIFFTFSLNQNKNFQIETKTFQSNKNFQFEITEINLETQITRLIHDEKRRRWRKKKQKEKMLEVKCLFGHFIPFFFVNLILFLFPHVYDLQRFYVSLYFFSMRAWMFIVLLYNWRKKTTATTAES